MKDKVIGIIPARFAASRFPGKLLADLDGRSVLQRVYGQAIKARQLSEVIVATDDRRIFNHARSFGAPVLMTPKDISNGTTRCAEALRQLDQPDIIGVINIQGDEPFVSPDEINTLASAIQDASNQIVTLVSPVLDVEIFNDINTVKAVLDFSMNALYFSRRPIPHFDRDIGDDFHPWMHIGLYGFSKKVLYEIVDLPPTNLELAERLEQLRWLEHGYKIKAFLTDKKHIGIDSPEDLEKALMYLKNRP